MAVRPATRIASAIILLVGLVATPALAALPGDLAQRIADTVRAGRDNERSEAERAARVGDPALAQMMAVRARDQSRAALDAVVVSAVAESPALAGEIVAAASSAAPELAPAIARHVSELFPFIGAAAVQSASFAPQAAVEPRLPGRAPTPATARGDGLPEPVDDPLEGWNRAVFEVNDVIDRFVLRPVAWVYGTVTPERAKRAVRNFARNLKSPVRLANDLLQVAPEDAGNTLARFVINTTIGVGGLFEVAEDWGMPYKPADFGQTLHSYGVGAGPYLVLPLLGPSTVRDGTGLAIDVFFDPLTYVLDTKEGLAVLGGRMVVRRESLIEPLDKLREGSIDYYAALRSAYYQDRAQELRKGAPAPAGAIDKEFEETE